MTPAQAAFWAAAAAVAAASLAPRSAFPAGGFGAYDAALHAAAYGVLAVLGLSLRSGRRRPAVLALALVAFGAGLEAAQAVAVDRTASLADTLANAAGVALGLACAAAWAFHVKQRRRAAAAPRPRPPPHP